MNQTSATKAAQWKPGKSANPGGRPSRKELKALLAERDGDGPDAKTNRERVLRHLLEIATKWEVMTIGYDRKLGEPIRVASGRDAVEAAKLLLVYSWGKPPASDEELAMAFAEHFRHISLDQFGVLIRALGDRLKTMTPEEFGRFAKMCDGDVTRYLRAAEAELSGTAPPIEASEAPQIEPPPAPETKGADEANDEGTGGTPFEPSPEPGPAHLAGDAPVATLDEDEEE